MNSKFLSDKAKELRRNSTEVEKQLWFRINNSQLGYHFYRQRIIDERYIVDFYCPAKRMVIELDGGQHCESKKDEIRDNHLVANNYKVLRFWNNEIIDNIEGCLGRIMDVLNA